MDNCWLNKIATSLVAEHLQGKIVELNEMLDEGRTEQERANIVAERNIWEVIQAGFRLRRDKAENERS
jgi:hypothetical protein